MNRELLAWLLGRFYRFLYGAFGLGFGLLWVAFGLGNALLITLCAILGWLLGKWRDEGGPDRGVRALWRRFFDGR
jgi:hypothetical protein